MKMAADLGELKSAWISSTADAVSSICLPFVSLTETIADTYKNGLVAITGKGTAAISAYTYTSASRQSMTVSGFSSASAPALNDLAAFAWWNPDKREKAWESIQESIRLVRPFWYRETIVPAATATLTLATGTQSHDLSAVTPAVDALIAIGVQPAATEAITWFEPNTNSGKYWTVTGDPGALTLRFLPNFNHDGSIADAYTGQKICLWYATWEAELTSEAGTTELPLDYFIVAGEIYRVRELNRARGTALQAANVNIPQMQALGQAALQRLGVGKRPLNAITQWTMGEAAETPGISEEEELEDAGDRQRGGSYASQKGQSRRK